MIGWIERIFHWGVVNIGGTVVGWVRDFIHGLYGFLHTAFSLVKRAWRDMWTDVHHLWVEADRFGHEVWRAIWHTLHKVIPDLTSWLRWLIGKVEKYAKYVLHWAVTRAEWLLHKIEHEITFVIRWVRAHIWDPLWKDIHLAWKWIFHNGRILWYYITHPDKLVGLIFDHLIATLEREAWKLGKLLGGFFLGLVLHNAKRFALLIEDIIVSLI